MYRYIYMNIILNIHFYPTPNTGHTAQKNEDETHTYNIYTTLVLHFIPAPQRV